MTLNQLKQKLLQEKEKLEAQLARMQTHLTKRENNLVQKQELLLESGPQGLQRQLSQMPVFLVPGDVGDINKVIWPSFFSTNVVSIPPDSQVDSGFSVSKTAGFIMIAYSKMVSVEVDLGGGNFTYTYINPDDDGAAGKAPGLSFNFRNSSSTREYMDTAVNMDHVGNPRFPTYLYAPEMVFPNQNIGVSFFNNDPATTYRASLTFYGIRIRIEDSYDLLSSVYGDESSVPGSV